MEDLLHRERGAAFQEPPDFESPAGTGTNTNTYVVTIQASDGGLRHDLYGGSDH